MNNKEAIIKATISLINEKGNKINEITMREISKKAKVGLGLVNYYFGNKEKLIELCVEYIVNDIINIFDSIKDKKIELSPFQKLEYLGNLTLTFLFEHYSISKVSMLTDMSTPKDDDNTHRTYSAYVQLVADCRPDWDEEKIKRKTFILIATMQHIFLRNQEIFKLYGIDLTNKKSREIFHTQMLQDILEV